ncbi:MMPL family transporter [Belnapia sp. T6]|uniref:MMPL family transporter n=1 Tax=Belnapia mucosa TaxID=2804532 RepID=A0ABS1V796_9PROT|nr:MMPL family transporter [Belnapia mucosa]MBL6457526.1 MMPL family transporter [Belnapia mucosa]
MTALIARRCAALAQAAILRPRLVVLLALLAALLSGLAVTQRFAMNTDVDALFPAGLPWRETEQRLATAFPQRERLIAVVVDGPTADAADRAAAGLAEALERRRDLFLTVRRPDALPFFRRNGLLFLEEAELRDTTERIIAAQPLLGTLAADPSLRGLATALGLVLEGVARGEAELSAIAAPLAALAPAAEAALDGRIAPPDWGQLFTGRAPAPQELRRFVLVQPRLDFSALSPGATGAEAIREAAVGLGLPAVRFRMTGDIAMADEEFASVAEGAVRNTLLSLALVALLLWLALRSWRLILPVLATLLLGLLMTAAFGALAIGPFNPLSIAFAVLFIGLGVDFGIQFAVRFREQRHGLAALEPAIIAAASTAGPGIVLAALAIAGGFLAFLPTDYRGVSELGAIAGFGMLVAASLSLSLLPALLRLAHPPGEAAEPGWAGLAGLEGGLARQARRVSAGLLLLALLAAAALPVLVFDFNPLNLRDPQSEAVATFRDLMGSAETTPNTLNVLAPSLEAAGPVAARLEALPEVARVMTLASFVPEGQAAKLALVQDAADLMGPTLSPPEVAPPPDDAAVAAALRDLARALTREADRATGPPAIDARRLATALATLAEGPPAGRALLDQSLLPGLRATLAQLNDALQAAPVTLQTLPPELARDWVAPDGRARIEAWPRDLSDDNAALRRFAHAVQSVAPDAGGMAISIQESSATIRHAFLLAGAIGLVWTVLLLLAALRSPRLALLALAPLLLAGLVTLAICAVVGPPLNLANIIALPLLFGIGVAFDIYFVVAWQGGERVLLARPVTRAVMFSALTTASAFGTLALSSHPGTASMGVLLAISLAAVLAAVLLALPALLHAFAGD